MLTRRAFLPYIAALAVPRSLTGVLSPKTLRVVSIVSGDRSEMLRGLSFGAAEAARSAALFGWSVLHRSATTPIDAQEADAFILGSGAGAPSTAKPVLRIACDASVVDDTTFRLASCEPDRVVWRADLDRYGAGQLNDRYRSATGSAMTAEAWLGWFALKVLTESALRAGSATPSDLVKHLANAATRFDGHKGTPLYFGADRRLVQPLYDATGEP